MIDAQCSSMNTSATYRHRRSSREQGLFVTDGTPHQLSVSPEPDSWHWAIPPSSHDVAGSFTYLEHHWEHLERDIPSVCVSHSYDTTMAKTDGLVTMLLRTLQMSQFIERKAPWAPCPAKMCSPDHVGFPSPLSAFSLCSGHTVLLLPPPLSPSPLLLTPPLPSLSFLPLSPSL